MPRRAPHTKPQSPVSDIQMGSGKGDTGAREGGALQREKNVREEEDWRKALS